MALKIAINGFGRIGRALARQIVMNHEYSLAAVNDPTDLEMSAYLFRHDSVHNESPFEISVEAGSLVADGQKVRYTTETSIDKTDFSDCDIVFECSGAHPGCQGLNKHFKGRVKKVILSSMPEEGDALPVFVAGLSDLSVLREDIVSAGSCSTNALALILAKIDAAYGIESGSVTSVHSYMSDQSILDARSDKNLRFSRAAALNIIPVPTGVAKNLSFILPSLSEKIMGFSVRVPVPNVTMLDITISMQKSATISQLNALFKKAAKSEYHGILDIDEDEKVSSDFVSSRASVTVATDLTQVSGKNNVKIVAWFDNETGYAGRLYDLINRVKEIL